MLQQVKCSNIGINILTLTSGTGSAAHIMID